MTHYIVLDVSQKMTAICIVDSSGRRLWRGQCPTDPAHSGDLERSFRSIVNTDSGDHEHPHEPARAGAGERHAVMLVRCH